MRKLLSIVTLLIVALGFSAKAYDCPENLYFYVSNGASTAFEKSGTVFTYTVDATADDVYGVIVNADAENWDAAHAATAYFANGKWGDIQISGNETWTSVSEWGTGWSNGCYVFKKGNKYDITLAYADGALTGSVKTDGEGGEGGGEGGEETTTDFFNTSMDYYIDASNCSWFFDGGAIIKVWDGAQNLVCETVAGSIVKFHPTAESQNKVYVKRVNPNNEGETWNELALAAPANGSDNMFVINSNFNGGEWSAYATPKAWIISKNVNGWSADAVSDYVFTYNEETGIYTVSVPADKLRTDDEESNGFKIGYGNLNDWNNYYGGVIKNKVMGKGVATDAVKNGQNFLIPTSATTPVELTFDPKEGKLTADWNVEVVDPIIPDDPEDTNDALSVSIPKMNVDGTYTVNVNLRSATNNEYCNAQWDITVPAGVTLGDITLNEACCPDHELITNVVDGVTRCLVYSSKNTPFVRTANTIFSFTLTTANAEPGDLEGSISNILFNVAPVDGNINNIAYKFADVPLNISIVKAVSKIVATPANLALAIGDSQAIELAIEPADATDKTVTWEIVSGENIIDLEDGTVTAKASGIATIKVTANDGFGASVSIDVTVGGKAVENIELSAEEHTMYIGETLQLTATVTPDDATNKAVMWISSDDNVATVDADGLVTGVYAGEATIYAVAKDGSGVEASCVVTIKAKVSGDADGDDILTIADIVIIAKKVVGIETEGALLENMDMDGDGTITSTDVTLAVYYLNQQTISDRPANAVMSKDMLKLSKPVAMKGNKFNLPLTLSSASSVAGIQFDIVVPEGYELTPDCYVAPEASNGHSMSITQLANATYRVVIYSAYNFNSSSLGYLSLLNKNNASGPANFKLNNVMYTDGSCLMATEDSSASFDIVSGIDSIFSDGARHDVYNTAGILVAPQADKAEVNALPAGIYIIGNTKVVIR